ncbi:hypothetical protein AAG906_001855 [Vitis piasezkii]
MKKINQLQNNVMIGKTRRWYHCSISHKDTFHWNSLIAKNATQNPQTALTFFTRMQAHAVPSNNFTFPALLKACAALRRLLPTLQVHAYLTRLGLAADRFSAAALVDAYGKCGHAYYAAQVFDEMPEGSVDVVSWTALISAYSSNGCVDEAFQAFGRMRWMRGWDGSECCGVDVVSLGALVSACAVGCGSNCLRRGSAVHGLVVKYGFGVSTHLGNSMVHMYSACKDVGGAWRVFNGIPIEQRDVVSWNSLISGFTLNGEAERALRTFEDMVSEGTSAVEPNRVTVIALLKSCAELGCVETSSWVHEYISSRHSSLLVAKDVVVLTALLDMHARCGNLALAREIFDGVEGKNVVCWSAMIAGYEQGSCPEEALRLFRQMLMEGNMVGVEVKPNAVTLVSVIAACSRLGASRSASMIHKYAVATGLDQDARIASALIDMCAKCGDIEHGRQVFSEMDESTRTVVSWSSMIGAEGIHGEGKRALELFSEMRTGGYEPNEITYISVLSACSHAGLVEQGKSCFNSMEKDYGMSPTGKHYACLVDLLGRAGHLDEAHNVILNMPIKADLALWGSLLAACHLHGNCKLGEIVEKKILSLDSNSVGHHVLLANMYEDAGRWDDVVRMRVELRRSGLRKIPGQSFIEIGNEVYSFMAEDRSHPESEMIYKELDGLDERVRKAAKYVTETGLNVEDGDIAGLILRCKYHSERLAIAFGLIMIDRHSTCSCSLRTATPIRITKNLRVCRDCHAYTKLVSKVIDRELIVRDAHRFHHFRDGFCSCGDYW